MWKAAGPSLQHCMQGNEIVSVYSFDPSQYAHLSGISFLPGGPNASIVHYPQNGILKRHHNGVQIIKNPPKCIPFLLTRTNRLKGFQNE